MNLYLYAIREHADENQLEKITDALTPPLTFRVNGVPVGFGDEAEEWAEWEAGARP